MDIQTHFERHVLTLEFNRPEKKNAITQEMYATLATALKDSQNSPNVRAILICGKPEVFTAGNDLQDFMQFAQQAGDNIENGATFQFMRALCLASKPVIAAVSGNAVGIGTTLLMHCDLIYAANNACFSMPFTQLGLCPEFASSLLLQRLAGFSKAAEKLMLGEEFGADEAHSLGLVNEVLPLDELLPYAKKQAAKLVALPASSIRATKRLMKAEQVELSMTKMNEELKEFAALLKSPEASEAFMAFFQKRKPDFTQFP